MITEQELKKLLHPPTYDLYILQGMSLKSLEELVEDVVGDGVIFSKDGMSYYCSVPLFSVDHYYLAEYMYNATDCKFEWGVDYYDKEGNEVAEVLWDAKIEEDEDFYEIVSNHILPKIKKQLSITQKV